MHKTYLEIWIMVQVALLFIAVSACSSAVSPVASSTPSQASSPIATTPVIPTSTFTLAPTFTPTLNPYNGPVKVYGYVKDVSGKPVGINVAFQGFDIGDQGFVTADANGYYEKTLAPDIQYIVSAEPGTGQQSGKYTFPAGYLPQSQLVVRNGPEARVDFVVRGGGILWLKAYTSSGTEMTSQDFIDTSVGAYPLGMYPYGDTIQAQYHGVPLYWG